MSACLCHYSLRYPIEVWLTSDLEYGDSVELGLHQEASACARAFG